MYVFLRGVRRGEERKREEKGRVRRVMEGYELVDEEEER